jgi:hypothetical protein
VDGDAPAVAAGEAHDVAAAALHRGERAVRAAGRARAVRGRDDVADLVADQRQRTARAARDEDAIVLDLHDGEVLGDVEARVQR